MNSHEQRGNEQTLPTFMATLSTWPQLTNGCHSCSAGLMPARQSVKFLASKSLLASMASSYSFELSLMDEINKYLPRNS